MRKIKKKKIKKKILTDLPYEVIVEILLFVPYKIIFSVMLTSKEFTYALTQFKFWLRKFKFEYPELDPYPETNIIVYYPKYIEEWYIKKGIYEIYTVYENDQSTFEEFIVGKNEWYLKTKIFIESLKYFKTHKIHGTKFYITGNELLLFEVRKTLITSPGLDLYFETNTILNGKFLSELVKLDHMVFFYIIWYYSGEKVYDRRVVIESLIDTLLVKDSIQLYRYFAYMRDIGNTTDYKYNEIIQSDKSIISNIIKYDEKKLKYFKEFLTPFKFMDKESKQTFLERNLKFLDENDKQEFLKKYSKIQTY